MAEHAHCSPKAGKSVSHYSNVSRINRPNTRGKIVDFPKRNRADWLLPNQSEPFVSSGSIVGDSGCASAADLSCRSVLHVPRLLCAVLKVEPHTGANKVLPQIPTFIVSNWVLV